MASETMQFTGTLEVVTCWCGITHAVPRDLHDFQKRQLRDGLDQRSIYCPLGHKWITSGESEAARLKRQLEWARDAAASERARRDQAETDARVQKAAKTRFKNQRDRERRRTAAGVCPCCNRTFKQLRRHMASQHPAFVGGEAS